MWQLQEENSCIKSSLDTYQELNRRLQLQLLQSSSGKTNETISSTKNARLNPGCGDNAIKMLPELENVSSLW